MFTIYKFFVTLDLSNRLCLEWYSCILVSRFYICLVAVHHFPTIWTSSIFLKPFKNTSSMKAMCTIQKQPLFVWFKGLKTYSTYKFFRILNERFPEVLNIKYKESISGSYKRKGLKLMRYCSWSQYDFNLVLVVHRFDERLMFATFLIRLD